MKRTILIIDDSEVILEVCRAILEGAGYQVITHARATGSVALILQSKPALVLLDVNMPSIRGDMVARMSSATRLATGTIVLLHSSLEESELKRLTEECGAHGYLRKTSNPHAFLRQIAAFLQDKESSVFRAARAAQGATTASASAGTPRSGGRTKDGPVLLINRDMAELSLLRRFVQELGHQPEFALSAQQGIEKLTVGAVPPAIVVSCDLPDSGARAVFEAALKRDPSFRERLILVSSVDDALDFPPGFSGMVITRPIQKSALEKVLVRSMSVSVSHAAQR